MDSKEYLKRCCKYYTEWESLWTTCYEENEDFARLMELSEIFNKDHDKFLNNDKYISEFLWRVKELRKQEYFLYLHRDKFYDVDWDFGPYYNNPFVAMQLGLDWFDLEEILIAPYSIFIYLDNMRAELAYPYPNCNDDWFIARRQEFIDAGEW